MDPRYEFGETRMGPQGSNRVVTACQLSFAQRCMDFLVADVMQQHRGAALAAFQLWNQVVQALVNIRRDRAPAQGADRRRFGRR